MLEHKSSFYEFFLKNNHYFCDKRVIWQNEILAHTFGFGTFCRTWDQRGKKVWCRSAEAPTRSELFLVSHHMLKRCPSILAVVRGGISVQLQIHQLALQVYTPQAVCCSVVSSSWSATQNSYTGPGWNPVTQTGQGQSANIREPIES